MSNNIPEVGIGGFFKFEAVNAETGERRLLADWFKNLITDQGMNRLGSGGGVSHVLVGSGSTPPANSDTQLASHVAVTGNVTANTSGYVAGPPYYVWTRYTWRFAQGAAAGNLSEVGVNWNGATSGSMFSRALIRDGNGNPTTITVLASEFLDVTYELRVYPPQTDVTFQATISGQTYNCTLRPSQLSNQSTGWVPSFFAGGGTDYQQLGYTAVYSGSLGPVTDSPSGSVANTGSSYTTGAYSNNSFQRDGSLAMGLNDGNLAGGIKVFVFQNRIGTFQVEFTPAIPKTNAQLLTLNMRVSWARRP